MDDKDDNPVTVEGDAAEGNGLVQMFCDCDSLELESLQVQTPDKRSGALYLSVAHSVTHYHMLLL